MSRHVVLDTNVLIAAFLKPLRGPSFSKDVFDYVVRHEAVYISPYILEEFRAKCLKKLKFSASSVSEMLALIIKRVHLEKGILEATDKEAMRLRDPKDRPLLALSLAVKADLLLTWDKDLLVLGRYHATTIQTPSDYWQSL